MTHRFWEENRVMEYGVVAMLAMGITLLVVHGPPHRGSADRTSPLRFAGGLHEAATTVLWGYVAVAALHTSLLVTGGEPTWRSVAVLLLWAAPVVAACLLVRRGTEVAVAALVGATAAIAAMSLSFVAGPHGWMRLEAERGPIRAIAVFLVTAVAASLAHRRPRPTGAMLLVVGLMPPMLAGFTIGWGGLFELAAVGAVPAVSGALLLAVPPQQPAPLPSTVVSAPAEGYIILKSSESTEVAVPPAG